METKQLNLLILVVLLAVLWLADEVMKEGMPGLSGTPQRMLVQESLAPDFSFETLDGKTWVFSSLKGKTVILNFWASWCAPCVAEFPILLDLAETRKDTVVFLAISIDAEKSGIRNFLKRFPSIEKHANVLIAHDRDKSISRDIFGTLKIPETIIIASDGAMIHKIVGSDWSREDMERFLDYKR